ncbi:hypothetical protein PIB30_031630 [Stylosanthes scabra]|uniref:Alpha/beta hydrolase fold-3 domain-containing protein n=1 Tax=Stylosanthes scabra TaxID=79078 RepID=A0ABU6WAA2_9FABA|nr:hypothetical protein [Stylosanthes scabra]
MSKKNEDHELFKIVHNPSDGTITLLRKPDPHSPPQSDPTLPIPVLSKDLTINPKNNTSLRLFLPRNALTHDNNNKLPLIVFFHPSGFILMSAATTVFHNFCLQMADNLAALVASVDYRLAPEHRLPAAYHDAMEALHFIKASNDEWLTKHVDYSTCYLMGSSSGANIAYHAGLRAASDHDLDLKPLKIKGLILRQVACGGTKRTESELRLEKDPILPLSDADLMWELALPVGVDRDHEYSNLTVGDGGRLLEKVRDQGWRVLVSGSGGDPLVDRNVELVKLMKEKGVCVVSDFEDDYGVHGVEFRHSYKAMQLFALLKTFISHS